MKKRKQKKLEKAKKRFSYIEYIAHTPCRNKVIGDSPDAKQQAVITEKQEMLVTIRGVMYKIVLTPGFVYDMATVPGIVTFIKSIKHHHLNPNTTLKHVSSFHDLFYVLKGILDAIGRYYKLYRMADGGFVGTTLTLTRAEIDWIYYLGLEYDQVKLIQDPDNIHGTRSMTEEETWDVYRGLVTFGRFKWNKNADRIIKGISSGIHKIRLFFGGY